MKIIKMYHLIMQILEIYTQIKEEKTSQFKILIYLLVQKILKDLIKYRLLYQHMKAEDNQNNREM